MKTLTTIVLATGFALAACGKKESTEAPPTTASGSGSDTVAAGSGSDSGSAAGSGSGSAAEPAAEVDVPTEVDFETIAAEEITDKTVDSKVKELEADLAP